MTTIIKKPFIDPIPLTTPVQKPSTEVLIEPITPEEKEMFKKETDRVKMRFKGFFSTKKPDFDLKPIPEVTIKETTIKPVEVKKEEPEVQTIKLGDEKSFHKSNESIDSFTRSRRITVKTTVKCFLSERKPQRSTDSDEYKIVKKEDKFEIDDSEPIYKIVDPIPLHLFTDKPIMPKAKTEQGKLVV